MATQIVPDPVPTQESFVRTSEILRAIPHPPDCDCRDCDDRFAEALWAEITTRWDAEADGDEPGLDPTDLAWNAGFALGRAMLPARAPTDFSDLELVAWHAGNHEGWQAAIREELDRLDAWDDVILSDREG